MRTSGPCRRWPRGIDRTPTRWSGNETRCVDGEVEEEAGEEGGVEDQERREEEGGADSGRVPHRDAVPRVPQRRGRDRVLQEGVRREGDSPDGGAGRHDRA